MASIAVAGHEPRDPVRRARDEALFEFAATDDPRAAAVAERPRRLAGLVEPRVQVAAGDESATRALG